MAKRKRKRLNKRFLALLIALGALALLGAAAVIIWVQPRDPERYAQRAARLQEEGKYAAAVRNFAIAAKESQDPEHFLSLGDAMLLQRAKDPGLGQAQRTELFFGARNAFREALRWSPGHAEAQRRLTDLEYQIARSSGHWEDYIDEATKLIQLVPDDHEVFFQRSLAKAEMAKSRPEYVQQVLEDFQKLLQEAPQEEKYWLGLVRFHASRRETDEAEQVLRRAIEANPDSVGLRVAYSSFIQQIDKDETRVEEARKLLADAIATQPENIEGYLAMANFHQRRREIDEAVKMLERAVSIDPADYRSYSSLSYLYLYQDDLEEAAKVLERGLTVVRESAGADVASLEGTELTKYRAAVMVLNHQLCDVLMDQIWRGAPEAQLLGRVEQGLEEMRGINPDHPYVAKISGRIALRRGELVEAERLLRSSYEGLSPRFDPKTAGLLIHVYERLNQLGEAQNVLERYLHFSRDNPKLLLHLVMLYVDYRQYDRAQRIVQEVLELDPESELAKTLDAGLKVMTGRIRRIPPEVTKLDASTARVFMQGAQQRWREGDQDGAILLAQDVLARLPKHLPAIQQLLLWHKDRREVAKAQALLRQASREFKDRPEAMQRLAMMLESDPEKRLSYQLALAEKVSDPLRKALAKAEIYRRFNKEKQCLDQLRAAESVDPDNALVIDRLFKHALAKSDWTMAEKYAEAAARQDVDSVGGKLYRAHLASAKRDYDTALRLATEALSARPRFSQIHAFLGDCHFATGDYEQARRDYEAAYEHNPTNVRALMGMVRVLERIGTPNEYEQAVELAYKFVPTDPGIRERYLLIQESRQDPEKVIRQREQRRKAEPNDLQNLSRLALLYERARKYNQAEEAYRAAYRLSNGSPAALRALAAFLRQTERDVEAQGLLADYVQKAADKELAYLIWAEYLENAGEIEKARSVYEKAVEFDENGRACQAMAAFAERQRDFATAVEYQKKYMARAGEKVSPRATYSLLNYMVFANQLEEAEKRLAPILAADPEDVEALTVKGLICLQREDYAKGVQVLTDALRGNPRHTRALAFRAEAHFRMGNKSLAVADLEAIRQSGAHTAPLVALRLVRIYDGMGDFGSAYAVLQNFLSERPDHREGLKARAELCLEHQRWSLLERALAEGREAYPRDPYYLLIEKEMWRRRGRPDRAIAALRTAAGLVGPERAPRVNLALAEVLVEADQYAQAAALCKQLQGQASEMDPFAFAIAGRCHVKLGNVRQAESDFTAAIKAAKPEQLSYVVQQARSAYSPEESAANLKRWQALRPDDWQMHYLLAEELLGQRDHEGAVEQLQAVLDKAKDDNNAKWQAYRTLGITYGNMKKLQQSRQAFEEALKLQPRDAATLNNLAWMLIQGMNKPAEALAYAEKAANLVPNNAAVLDTYGLALELAGDLGKAGDVLRRSIAIQPLPANRLHLGSVYEKAGRKEDALRQYRLGWELVRDNPDDVHHKQLRAAVEKLGGSPG